MRDQLVEKYQYYMTEAARLLELVNEQDAYITKLEEALDALSESKGHGEEHGAEKSNEEEAQNELGAVDRDMAKIMPWVKANKRPYLLPPYLLPKKKPVDPVDLTPEALELEAQRRLEK